MRFKNYWLIGLMFLIVLIIIVGGTTRLTKSGLSITEWKPITGILPPLSDEGWQGEFNKYQQTPEYLKTNYHFELSDFKKIFFWEYIHRLLGRLIFLYILIFGFVLIKKSLLKIKIYLLLLSLVLFQGLMGWVMVRSGLQNEPRVSPYLLSVHFYLATTLLIITFSIYVKDNYQKLSYQNNIFFRYHYAVGLLLFLQIFYGNLTSGLKAGLVSDTFPLMNGALIPDTIWSHHDLFLNFFENPFMVLWLHRGLGMCILVLVSYVYYHILKSTSEIQIKKIYSPLVGCLILQVILGIMLLLSHIPVWLGVTHQFVGIIVILSYFFVIFRLEYVPSPS